MTKFDNYIGNAKIITPSELPKIGDKGGIGHTNESCVAVELTESPAEFEDYLFYNVSYANLEEYFEKGIDVCHFLMAIKREDFVKFYSEVK